MTPKPVTITLTPHPAGEHSCQGCSNVYAPHPVPTQELRITKSLSSGGTQANSLTLCEECLAALKAALS